MVTTRRPKRRQATKANRGSGEGEKLSGAGLSFHGGGVSNVSQKGQVTITANLRRALSLRPGDRVMMYLQDDGTIRLQRMLTFSEAVAQAPKVQPIDWKRLEQERREEVAERIWRELHPDERGGPVTSTIVRA